MYKKEVRINGKRLEIGRDKEYTMYKISIKNTNKLVKYLNNENIIPIKW